MKLLMKARRRNLNISNKGQDGALSELSKKAKQVYNIKYKDTKKRQNKSPDKCEKSMRLKVEREIIPKASFLMGNLVPLRTKRTMDLNDLELPQKGEQVTNGDSSSSESIQSYGGYQINIKADNEARKKSRVLAKSEEEKLLKDEEESKGSKEKEEISTDSLKTSSITDDSSYTSSKVSRNENFLQGTQDQKLEMIKICHLNTTVRRRSNINNARDDMKPEKELEAKPKALRKSRRSLGTSEFSNMVNEIRVRHNLMRGSKMHKKKTLISKLGSLKPKLFGTNRGESKKIPPESRKVGTTIFEPNSMAKSLDFVKLKRTNTQGLLIKNNKNLLEKDLDKKNFNRKASVSNYSILSIHKERSQMENKMNSIIQKSPTLSRHRRKSTFMMRLPQTLKKVMNLQVQNAPVRRSSFQSGILSLNANGGDSDGLSAIESEESADSKDKNTVLDIPKTSAEPKKDERNRSQFYKKVYQNLKKQYFSEIQVDGTKPKEGSDRKYLYKKDLRLYQKQNTQNFDKVTIDRSFVDKKMESLKLENGKMVGDMLKKFGSKAHRPKNCKRKILVKQLNSKMSSNTLSQFKVYKTVKAKRPNTKISKILSINESSPM